MSFEAQNSIGTSQDEDRIQRRREKVRNNVRALRQRRKEAAKSSQLHEFDNLGFNNNCHNSNQTTNPVLKNGSNQISLRCELSQSKVGWRLNLPYRLSAGSSIQDAYIAAFRHHCCASQASRDRDGEGVYISIGCGSWIQSICMQSSKYEPSLISQALSASGMATLGAIRHDAEMLSIAQNAQSEILCELRRLIDEYKEKSGEMRLHFTSIALFTCAVTDLLINKSWSTFSLHLEGLGALIESAGPEALSSPEAFENYKGYRSIQLTFSFIERKTSFLSHPRWANLPAPSRPTTYEVQTGRLLDIIYQIPELMQTIDANSSWSSTIKENNSKDMQQELTRITEISASLDSWENACNFWSSTSCLDRPKMSTDKPWEEELAFGSDDACKLWTYSCGARIALYELALAISTISPRPNGQELGLSSLDYSVLTHEWAVRGCQSLNYLSRKQNNVAGKLYALFCLDMTWKAVNTLHNDYGLCCGEELRWCERLAVVLGDTGLPILRAHLRPDST